MRPVVEFIQLNKQAVCPTRGSEHASGLDLYSAQSVVIAPGERATISTGLRIAIQTGFEGQVRPRSGLAANHGITVLNSPGTIDADYRGELKVILVNHSAIGHAVQVGDRIAQLVIAPVCLDVDIVMRYNEEESSATETARGQSGLGSTGR